LVGRTVGEPIGERDRLTGSAFQLTRPLGDPPEGLAQPGQRFIGLGSLHVSTSSEPEEPTASEEAFAMEEAGASKTPWALILGASSGFGQATSLALAREGFNIFGVHLDRKATLANVEQIEGEIRAAGAQAVFFNINAADPVKRGEVIGAMRERTADPPGTVRVLMHSLAFGALRPLIPTDSDRALTDREIVMTLDVMANSLVYWTQDLLAARLLEPGGRIFAMTSAGDAHAWPAYGAVSAAKCALEAYCRQLALELAPQGIAVNALRAGVTDTPALRKIPGSDVMLEASRKRNPSGRLTRPEDVAGAIVALSHPTAGWITGNVIGVDGGEEVAT
jgi:NAD(P)-dependent dehydrogenase (short-subunit alcohol dehydrogenase family)